MLEKITETEVKNFNKTSDNIYIRAVRNNKK
jgi:hypothetical protein